MISIIEHTCLKYVKANDLYKLVDDVRRYGFYGICVLPPHVKAIKGSRRDIKVITVIDFPFGHAPLHKKMEEAELACAEGADELDVVMNIPLFFRGKFAEVSREITALKVFGVPIKVIIETCYLDNASIKMAANLCSDAGADFIKTSTGFGPRGCSVEDVKIIREVLPPTVGIKAAGGIRTLEFAEQLVEAGATRIGSSSAVAIAEEYLAKHKQA